MEFTTRFGLHSQTTRLREGGARPGGQTPPRYWASTVSGGSLNLSLGERRPAGSPPSVRHNSLGRAARGFSDGLFPLRSPLLGESLLVSFPPLTDMLKFSGSSRLT